MDALLLELRLDETRKMLLEDIDGFRATAESLAGTAETLPADVRAEVEAAVETTLASLEQAHPRLQATLREATALADQISAIADKGERMAIAWEATANSAAEVVALAMPPGEPGEPADPEEDPFDVNEWTDLATRTGTTLEEARSLLADLDGSLGPGGPADQMAGRFEALVDRATWRGVMLILVALCAAIVYRFVSTRILRSRPATPGATAGSPASRQGPQTPKT